MNRIKTKSRCRLEPYHLDQLMTVKSIITASGTADDESATYEDSAINIDKVYKHWKTTKTRRNYLKIGRAHV